MNSRKFLRNGECIFSYIKEDGGFSNISKSICRLCSGIHCAALLCLQFLGINAKILYKTEIYATISICKENCQGRKKTHKLREGCQTL